VLLCNELLDRAVNLRFIHLGVRLPAIPPARAGAEHQDDRRVSRPQPARVAPASYALWGSRATPPRKKRLGYNQPFSSAMRSASARFCAPSLRIAALR
jgi:hypothetical protein